jgi:phage tail sheath gpL-like
MNALLTKETCIAHNGKALFLCSQCVEEMQARILSRVTRMQLRKDGTDVVPVNEVVAILKSELPFRAR